VKQGHEFSKNSKLFTQAMMIYSNLFLLNLGGPSYDNNMCENKKSVQFIVGEHFSLFVSVANIYKEAKVTHRVQRSIFVILSQR